MYQVFEIYIIPIVCLLKVMQCCPSVCICNTLEASGNHNHAGKVICTPQSGFNSWDNLQMQEVPNNTVLLVIQSPKLTDIPAFTFSALSGLKKLDLSRSNICEIHENAFFNLGSLEKLNLSYNKMKKLDAAILKPLISLTRLNLQGNLLSHLDENHMNMIPSLKFLDISNNPLICDCHIKWLHEWLHSSKVRLPAKTLCQFPKGLQRVPFSRVPEKNFHCQWPLQLPLFDLSPNVDQLVFERDSFILSCEVSYMTPDINITWSLNGETMQLNDSVSYQLLADSSILKSVIFIEKLCSHHSGIWQCLVNSSAGTSMKQVQLLVITNNGTVCPQTVSIDNKGQHVWPETPSGVTVEIECIGKKLGVHRQNRAYYTCTRDGVWSNLNTENCPYVSEVTNVLEHFSKINISFTHSGILDSAYLLRNYTSDYKLFNDKMDVIYASRTLQNYISVVPNHPELAEIIVDVVNTLLYLNRSLLQAAQAEDQSCSRLLWILEQLPDSLMDIPLNHVRENIAVEEFFVKAEGFTGIRCSSFMKNNNMYGSLNWTSGEALKDQDDKVLNCNIANISIDTIDANQGVEASLQLPATIFQKRKGFSSHSPAHKVQFIIYRNSLLFPYSAVRSPVLDITSSIISGKIACYDARNLSEPVLVSLRTAAYTSDIKPVWWDSQAIGGKGAWSEDGCSILKVHKNIVTFACNKLASFGLLQNVEALMNQYAFEKAQFHFGHPAIYIGSAPCVVLLIVTLSSYCYAYTDIKMPNSTKHSLMNTFLTLLLLCITFTLGIFQIDIIPICQAFGFILHYFTLSTLFWMLVSSSNLCKKVKKSENLHIPSSDSVSEYSLPPKPMLRFYLVGWGIPSIIVGISAAVNIENYGGKKLCFLSFNPCLGALYCPGVLLLLGICCLYLLVFHELQKKTSSVGCISSELACSDALEELGSSNVKYLRNENNLLSDEMLLQGYATLLFIFLVAWITGAASAARLFERYIPHDELLFSLLYCISSLSLGLYSFIFFWWKCPAICFNSRIIFFKKQTKNVKTVMEFMPMVAIGKPVISSNIDQGNLKDKICEKNTISAFDSSSLPATSDFTNSSGNSLNTSKVFYDPWQNIVAKRFFEKCRRQKMHQFREENLAKATVSDNVKSSNTSDSSHIISDSKSEPSNAMLCKILSVRKPSENLTDSKRISCSRLQGFSSLASSECRCLSIHNKPVMFSDENNFASSSLYHNICSHMSTDVHSDCRKQYKHLKKRHRKHVSCRHTNTVVKHSSFSEENLKCDHRFCQCQNLYHSLSKNGNCSSQKHTTMSSDIFVKGNVS